MTLYDIDHALLELCDPDTGELLDFDAFAKLQMARDNKLENIALWVKDLDAQAKAIKQEEAALENRRKPLENKRDRLKAYLSQMLDGNKFETARCSVTFRKTTSVDISDLGEVVRWAKQNNHMECVREKPAEVSKHDVAKLLKAGIEIPRAVLVESQKIGIK